MKISTLAHSLTHIKKIPPNINCCVALFDKNENIKTYLQFIRVTSLCSREPVRNELLYLYLWLMPVFHLKITVRLVQRVLLTQSRSFIFSYFPSVRLIMWSKKVWYLHNNYPAGDISHQLGILSADNSSLLIEKGLARILQRVKDKTNINSRMHIKEKVSSSVCLRVLNY